MRGLRFNPFKSMRGAVIPTTPTNLATATLYNNSIIGELLALWVLNFQTGTAAFGGATILNAKIGSPAGTTHPLVAGEAQQAGLLTYIDTATAYPFDMQGGFGIYNSYFFSGHQPFCILRAGWSFVIQDPTTGDTPAGFSLIWQACHMEDLTGEHCDICDVVVVT